MFALLAVLVFFVSAPVGAQPVSGSTELEAGRQISIQARHPGQAYDVWVSPNVTTSLLFDTPVQLSELEKRELFRRVLVAEDAILLVPSRELKWGMQLRMTVLLADGTSPTTVDFTLRVGPSGQAERQVEVSSERAVELCPQERQELQQCRAELERKCVEPTAQGTLTSLLASGWMDERGVLTLPLTKLTQPDGQNLRLWGATSYRAYRSSNKKTMSTTVRVAVELWMSNEGAQPWTVVGAALLAEDGTRHALSIWQSAPIETAPQRLVVEAELRETDVRGPFTLELRDEGHANPISIGAVSFP